MIIIVKNKSNKDYVEPTKNDTNITNLTNEKYNDISQSLTKLQLQIEHIKNIYLKNFVKVQMSNVKQKQRTM